MDVQAWRAAQEEAARQNETTFDIRGLPLVVRKIEIHDLALQGQIPLPLLSMLEQTRGKLGEMSQEQMAGVDAMARTVVKAAAVRPRVVDKPAKNSTDQIGIDELTASERFDVFTWCLSGVRALEKFRTGQEPDDSAVANGRGISREALPDTMP